MTGFVVEKKDYQEHFLRQRRNLMGFSSFVFFLNVSGARLDKINILGNEIEIYRHGFLMAMLFLVVLYFLIRYFQYYFHLISPVSSYVRRPYGRKIAWLSIRKELDKGGEFSEQWGGLKNIQLIEATYMGVNFFSGNVKVSIKGEGLEDEVVQRVFPPLEIKKRILPLTIAFVESSLKTPVFTEYVLPVLLALIGLSSFVFRFSESALCLT